MQMTHVRTACRSLGLRNIRTSYFIELGGCSATRNASTRSPPPALFIPLAASKLPRPSASLSASSSKKEITDSWEYKATVYRFAAPIRSKQHVMKIGACLLAGAGVLASLWLLLMPPLPPVAAAHIDGERLGWALLFIPSVIALQIAYLAIECKELDVSMAKAMAAGTCKYGDAFGKAVMKETDRRSQIFDSLR